MRGNVRDLLQLLGKVSPTDFPVREGPVLISFSYSISKQGKPRDKMNVEIGFGKFEDRLISPTSVFRTLVKSR
jgi:hypothetical protein